MIDGASLSARRPRQADIADRAGVSISTVSRVLANEPGISDSVRRHVLQVAEEIGYPARRQTSGPGHQLVALVHAVQATADLSSFYDGVLRGLREAAEDAGMPLAVRLTYADAITREELERHLAEEGAGGLFLVGVDAPEATVRWLREAGIPVVLVNGADPSLQFDCVSPSNFYGARQATELLLAAGHRRLAYLTRSVRPTLRERIRGFEAAIAATPGARGTVVELKPGETGLQEGINTMKALIAEGTDVTAVLCLNDLIAVGAMEAAQRAGRRVPDDISFMGFDGLPCAAMASPRLATMDVPREKLGREALALMQARLASPHEPARQVLLAVQPQAGGSVAPPGS